LSGADFSYIFFRGKFQGKVFGNLASPPPKKKFGKMGIFRGKSIEMAQVASMAN
jgi:Fe2+ transport system protein FeoA